jgi:hypothetical protein
MDRPLGFRNADEAVLGETTRSCEDAVIVPIDDAEF